MRPFARRYRPVEELGRGGMGVVWRAHDERLGRDVAVKVLHDWVADDPALRRRFEREAAALALLQHPHVVRLYDVAEERGRTLLVMELVAGSSLAAVAANRVLGWHEARALCEPVTDALAYAHRQGVTHRDLTPSNVLVERGSGRVVVSDFGLARLARSGRSQPASAVLAGTPEFWAPEQAAGLETGPPADLYALGCLLFGLLSGRMPFTGDDRLAVGLRRVHEPAPALGEVAPAAPPEACRLVDSLLQRDPADRPTAADARAALRTATTDRPAPITVARRPSHPAGRPTLPTAACATVVQRAEPTLARRRRPYIARRRARLAAAGVALAGVAAASGGGVYALASMEPPGIDAPRVVGQRLTVARARVAAAAERADVAHPAVHVIGRAYSERASAGTIISQDPAPGEHVAATGALDVRVSLGTPWATVPQTVGARTSAARARLAAAGFRTTRRYAPSLTVPAWHVAETRPAGGLRARRPATVTIVVSTGLPRTTVVDVRGQDSDDAVHALERAGFAVTVDEAPSPNVEAGRVLEVSPAPGTRAPIGTTVRVVVAREPRWESVTELSGDDDRSTDPLRVPGGARVVLVADNTSFLGLLGGGVTAEWSGDAAGSVEVAADGGGTVLVEPARHERLVSFALDKHGSARWTLRVEALR